MMGGDPTALKPVHWVGSSRRDLKTFPRDVQRDIGQALYAAQRGEEYPSVKALKGFGDRSVLEIVAGTYRTCLHSQVSGSDLCASCLSKEIQEGHRHATDGNRTHS